MVTEMVTDSLLKFKLHPGTKYPIAGYQWSRPKLQVARRHQREPRRRVRGDQQSHRARSRHREVGRRELDVVQAVHPRHHRRRDVHRSNAKRGLPPLLPARPGHPDANHRQTPSDRRERRTGRESDLRRCPRFDAEREVLRRPQSDRDSTNALPHQELHLGAVGGEGIGTEVKEAEAHPQPRPEHHQHPQHAVESHGAGMRVAVRPRQIATSVSHRLQRVARLHNLHEVDRPARVVGGTVRTSRHRRDARERVASDDGEPRRDARLHALDSCGGAMSVVQTIPALQGDSRGRCRARFPSTTPQRWRRANTSANLTSATSSIPSTPIEI